VPTHFALTLWQQCRRGNVEHSYLSVELFLVDFLLVPLQLYNIFVSSLCCETCQVSITEVPSHPRSTINDYFGLLHAMPSNPSWNYFVIISDTYEAKIYFFFVFHFVITSLSLLAVYVLPFSVLHSLVQQGQTFCFHARFP
jgi:hypothetical protein